MMLSGHGDMFKVLGRGRDAGKTFSARIDVEPVLDVDSSLGSDQRMQSVLRILPEQGVKFERNDLLLKLDDGAKYVVIKREDNASVITVDYWVEQQI